MENASKALLIAGGVLLTIIILSVIMLMYNNMSNAQRELENQKITAQFSKINEQIEVFTSSKTIYGSELLSLCNLIEDYSKKYPKSEGYTEINMTVNLGSGITGWTEMQGSKSYKDLVEIYEKKKQENDENSLTTTFKNKKFKCIQTMQDSRTHIINNIIYEMK